MNDGTAAPFRNGYSSGRESFSQPRPPTRGGGGSRRSSSPSPTLSPSLPPPPLPSFPPPPEKAPQRQSSTASSIARCNTPPTSTQTPNNRSSLPAFSSTRNPNGNGNKRSSLPPPTAPQPSRIPQPRNGSSSSTSASTSSNPRSQPAPLPSLPATIDEDDPMLEYAPETWVASMIGTSGLLYRFSESLVYKLLVSQREYLLMDAAGPLTLRPLTRVLWKDTNQNRLKGIVEGRTKAVIMEFGKKFRPSDIPPHKLRNVVIDMLMLVQMLHNQCGIVHGDIKPSNFLWGREGRLKIAGFNSARFIEEDPDLWSDEHVSEAFLTPERMRTREGSEIGENENGNGNGNGKGREEVKRTPAPKVFDDYYALGITLWWVYTGKSPANGQFNRRDIRKSDLGEVPDELVRRWIRKVFKMAGCRFW